MPLIIITGYPCSGKTHRAQQLADHFSARIADTSSRRGVLHIRSQHDSGSDANARNTIYSTAAAEKTTRAAEFSAVKRAVKKDVVVLADGLNYIKGYRYQLWCEAKAAGTRCCVVHVAASMEEVERWNEERRSLAGIDEGEDEKEKKTGGVQAGGGLMLESHTAIYGDGVRATQPISRRSSVGAQLDGDDIRIPLKDGDTRSLRDDSLTLKSLYIRDGGHASHEGQSPTQSHDIPHSPTTANTPLTSPALHTPPSRLPAYPPPSPPYSHSILKSLIMRYEPPSPFSRWDTPLFTIPTSDPTPPYGDIWNAIFPPHTTNAKAPSTKKGSIPARNGEDIVKPHVATVLPPSTSAEALQILEKVSSEVTTQILAWNRDFNADNEGGRAEVCVLADPLAAGKDEVEIEIDIPPGLIVTQPMLQRLRRRFVQIQRGSIAHGQGYAMGRRGVAEGFGRFLAGEFSG